MRGEPGRGLWEDRCRQRPAGGGKGICKGPEVRTQFRPVRGGRLETHQELREGEGPMDRALKAQVRTLAFPLSENLEGFDLIWTSRESPGPPC